MKTLRFGLIAIALSACAPEPIETVVLSPESPEVAEALRLADARWEAAGIAADRIVIEPGGSPVRLVEREHLHDVPAEATDVTRSIGRGGTYVGVRYMELTSLDLDRVTHEMGHAIGINVVALDVASHVDGPETDEEQAKLCAADAPNRPLMCRAAGTVITTVDLGLACSVTDCVHFKPEHD